MKGKPPFRLPSPFAPLPVLPAGADPAEALFACGLARLKARDALAAVALFEEVARRAPGHPGLDEALIAAYRRDARYHDALSLADAVLARDPVNIEALFERAVSLARLGKAREALAAFDAVLLAKPDHAAAWYDSHGPALDLIGMDEALRRLDMAATRERANGRYWAMPYVYHLIEGRKEAANALFARRLARHPNRRALADGVAALLPHLAPGARLFGVSAHLLRHALAEARETGLVLEFGVRRGASLAHIANAAGQEVHGFDSFMGLPEDWRNRPAGALSTGADLPEAAPNAALYPGWFADTLPAFLDAHPGPARFVNIDSDLYSSARTVLTALAPRLVPGTVLVFDEMIGNPSWREDEYKAFMEFITSSGRSFEIIALAPFTKQVAVRLIPGPAPFRPVRRPEREGMPGAGG